MPPSSTLLTRTGTPPAVHPKGVNEAFRALATVPTYAGPSCAPFRCRQAAAQAGAEVPSLAAALHPRLAHMRRQHAPAPQSTQAVALARAPSDRRMAPLARAKAEDAPKHGSPYTKPELRRVTRFGCAKGEGKEGEEKEQRERVSDTREGFFIAGMQNFAPQSLAVRNTSGQTLPRHHPNLYLRHVQPTAVLGRVVDLLS